MCVDEGMQVEFGYAHQGPRSQPVAQQPIIVLPPPVDKAEEQRQALLAARQAWRSKTIAGSLRSTGP